ncbi:helix-turn-helix domain-containing protein [Streptomyces canus]
MADAQDAHSHPGEIRTRPEFAAALRELRARSGTTIRTIARETGIPYGTIGGYFSGRHLPSPSPATLLTSVLTAIGVSDEESHLAWHETLRRIRPTPGPTPAEIRAPYQGMESFQPEDAAWFFGREDLVEALLSKVSERPLVAVVGASGAGKSSLLRAGLLPRLHTALLLTPSADPMAQLCRLLDLSPGISAMHAAERLRSDEDAPERVLVIDQFEDVFSPEVPEETRQGFLALIGALTRPVNPPLRVVFGLRADFYDHALRHPTLASALQESQLLIGPMTEEQLRRAITEPAHKARADIDDGLVELLLRDLAGPDRTVHEPGALPLLSHALLTTWELGSRRRMTVQGYRQGGGIHGAVAQSAEEIYESLGPARREQARALFLRMVRVSEDTADTRRRVPWSDLAGDHTIDTDDILYRFVEARLVTIDTHTIEISHDALLHSWPRLRNWIDVDRTKRLVGQQVQDAALAWEREGHDPAALYRGTRLSVAQQWLASAATEEVTPIVRRFLKAGTTQDLHERSAARRRTRRLQWLAVALTVVVLIAVGTAVYAFAQRSAAVHQRDLAVSRQLAVEADKLRVKDPALAAQLSLMAYRTAQTTEARSSLLRSYAGPAVTRLVGRPGVMQAVAVSPNRQVLATAGEDGTIQLWSLGSSKAGGSADGSSVSGSLARLNGSLRAHTKTVFALAFSPDGRTLASGGGDRTVRLWRVPAHGGRLEPLGRPITGPSSTVYAISYRPDGRTLAAGSADGTVRLWDVTNPGRPVAGPSERSGASGSDNTVQSVAFSTDGGLLASAGKDGTVRLWRVTGRAGLVPYGTALTGPAKTVFGVAFSPDGRTVAAASADASVWRWDLGDSSGGATRGTAGASPGKASQSSPGRRGQALTGPGSFLNSVAFSPDGRCLAAASSDGTVWLWNTRSWQVTRKLPHPGPVTAAVFLDWPGADTDSLSTDRGSLVTSGSDGVARVWDLPGPEIPDTSKAILTVSNAARRHTFAVADLNGAVRLWDLRDPRHPAPLSPLITHATRDPARTTGAVALSPDAATLAVGDIHGGVQLWDVTRPTAPVALPARLSAGTANVETITFSPNGRVVAVGNDDRTTRLWNVSDPRAPELLGSPLTGPANYVYSVAFSPDGRTLASGSADQKVRLWDIRDPEHPRPLGHPLRNHSSYVFSVAFAPKGHLLATAGADNRVRLWDVSDPAAPHTVGPALTGPTGYVFSAVFDSAAQTLAASAGDATTWLWNVADPHHPHLLATLTGSSGANFTSTFDTGRPLLAVAGSDPSVWLWNTDPDQVATHVCATAGSPITRAEWSHYLPGHEYRPPCG